MSNHIDYLFINFNLNLANKRLSKKLFVVDLL